MWKKKGGKKHSVHNSAFELALFAFSFSADFSVFQLPPHSVSASQVAATLSSTWAAFGRCSVRSKPSAWIWVFFSLLLSSFLSFIYVFKAISSPSDHSLATSILLGPPSIRVFTQSDYCQKLRFCGTSDLAGHQASAPAAGAEAGGE